MSVCGVTSFAHPSQQHHNQAASNQAEDTLNARLAAMLYVVMVGGLWGHPSAQTWQAAARSAGLELLLG
jgi:hypothetical protein